MNQITLLLLLSFFLWESLPSAETFTLSPRSHLSRENRLSVKFSTMTQLELAGIYGPMDFEKITTENYCNFTRDPIRTGGSANCTSLLFIDHTRGCWAIWHFPLEILLGQIQNSFFTDIKDPETSFLMKKLTLAYNGLMGDFNPSFDHSMYIFGGGLNSPGFQKQLNQEIIHAFSSLGIKRIFDMTPHDQHGHGPILDLLMVGRGIDQSSPDFESIQVKYFYGEENFSLRMKQYIVTPRLIGGTILRNKGLSLSSLVHRSS